MANEEALRRQALTLHQQGKKVAAIALELGRTRQWVHKWIKRYDAQSDNWCSSHSHAPRNNQTSKLLSLRCLCFNVQKCQRSLDT